MGTFAAEHLSPAYPERAARGTADKLRAWQAAALQQYLADLANMGMLNSGGVVAGRGPFGLTPGVGFQPIIETLPEGANLMAMAIISADRNWLTSWVP